MRVLPSAWSLRALLVLAALAGLALLAGLGRDRVLWLTLLLLGLGLLWALADAWWTLRVWRAAPLSWRRQLPEAFALRVPHELSGELTNVGPRSWQVALFDGADASFELQGLPLRCRLRGGASATLRYRVLPLQRGRMRFAPAELRLLSRGRSLELQLRVGEPAQRPVLPNFAAVARYAWLATDGRLAAIGIKPQVRRGEGTDFQQLAEYRRGDALRHIDWKATLKHARPIVREFQDERDQRVIFLLDCGRRMRADEGLAAAPEGSHFDQALNALMLLAHVALKDGDEVGALSFGNSAEQVRRFAPRKGMATLAALTMTLHDIQPEAVHSDYLLAARDLMRMQPKRALVVLLTNFRDEDAPELGEALRLLRTRHLVLLASLRERVLRELAEQPLADADKAVEVAAAHHFAQSRDDAFRRLAERDALMVDAEPERLAVDLVNRYRAVKRAGLL